MAEQDICLLRLDRVAQGVEIPLPATDPVTDTCFGGPTPTELGLIFSGLSGGLPEAVRAALIALSESELATPPPSISSLVLAACRDVLLAVLRHHLGKDLRVVEFISKLNRSLLI